MKTIFLSLSITLAAWLPVSGEESLAQIVEKLGAEDFLVRAEAQKRLDQKIASDPKIHSSDLLPLFLNSQSPEIKFRLRDSLIKLVTKEHFGIEPGFLGISMQEARVGKNRSIVVVRFILKDSAAEKAGLQANDIIVGVDELRYKSINAMESFRTDIKTLGAGTKFTLHIQRQGKDMSLPVTLGRREVNEQLPDTRPLEKTFEQEYAEAWLRKQQIHADKKRENSLRQEKQNSQ